MANEGAVVGYIRTNEMSTAYTVQREMIIRYCPDHGIKLYKIYEDIGFQTERHATDIEVVELLGLSPKKSRHAFPGWESMLTDVLNDKISCILVDTKLRLYFNEEQKEAVTRICKEKQVQIIEVSGINCPGDENTVAIYHYSIRPGKRTKVVLKDLDDIYNYVHKNFKDCKVLMYMDLDVKGRDSLNQAVSTKSRAVIVKSFFHINRKTSAFVKCLRRIQDNGSSLVSITEGEIRLLDGSQYKDLPLSVAIYNKLDSTRTEDDIELSWDILKTYVTTKTAWSIQDEFTDIDISEDMNRSEKKQKEDMIFTYSLDYYIPEVRNISKKLNENLPIYMLNGEEVIKLEKKYKDSCLL